VTVKFSLNPNGELESYKPLITPVLVLIESPAGSPVAEYTIVRPRASVTPPALIVMGAPQSSSLTVISVSAANAPPVIGAGSAAATMTVRFFVLVFHLASVAV
jgi:hypothetical protein